MFYDINLPFLFCSMTGKSKLEDKYRVEHPEVMERWEEKYGSGITAKKWYVGYKR